MKITIDKAVLERVLNAILYAVPQTASQAKEQLESLLVLRGALAQPTSGDYARGYAEGFNDACKPAQPQQDPKFLYDEEDGLLHDPCCDAPTGCIPLYTSPPARKPLTDERLWKIWNSQGDDAMEQQAAINFARAIEAAHNIKENT